MGNPPDNQNDNKVTGFKRYVSKRIVIAVVMIAVVVWAFSWVPSSVGRTGEQDKHQVAQKTHRESKADTEDTIHESTEKKKKANSDGGGHSHASESQAPQTDAEAHRAPVSPSTEGTHPLEQHDDAEKVEHDTEDVQPEADESHATDKASEHSPPSPHNQAQDPEKHDPSPHDATSEPDHKDLPKGVTFTDAAIGPLEFELNDRFWGWRPNDIINLTDNINNFQLGVLEVTRRTVVLLAERLSRTGTTDAFDPHLENAMNWLMVRSTRYWFPSPESKYKESIKEVKAYRDALMKGRGSFFTRTDNLIPLLSSYEDLLGSCDENLVKQKNEDGKKVSLFKADDYFYYAKGVANAMATVLEAVHHDFLKTIKSRHAEELLHHAIASCHQAAGLDPLLITNGDLDGILANHRANMAAPISHARFYISQLIKTLST
jgi:hypothetical protein